LIITALCDKIKDKKEKEKMVTHSLDLRERVVACYNLGNISLREVADRFMINKNTANKWVNQFKQQGNLLPKKVGTQKTSQLEPYKQEVIKMVEEHPDYTLAEYCEYCDEKMEVRVSESTMCRYLQQQNLSRKKKLSERVKLEQKRNNKSV
jgi:putative transposase